MLALPAKLPSRSLYQKYKLSEGIYVMIFFADIGVTMLKQCNIIFTIVSILFVSYSSLELIILGEVLYSENQRIIS